MITVKTFVFNLLAENTYLLYDETKEAVLIDCGCMYASEERMLSDFIAQNGIKLKRLLCTHLHFDHILGNNFIFQTYGISPEAHRKDVKLLPSIKEQIKSMKVHLPIHFIDIHDFIVGNQTITFGKSELLAMLVPGHSPGSLAYYSHKDGIIVVGDTLFKGSIGRTDLWGGNYDMLVAAIRDKIFSLPEETIVYPGHGPFTTVASEKLHNPFL
ncbi:MAG: MBL fold metallo-hydrolase [Tannerella sp.]|jgi:glyoxylase-like metal-dependent hydrolase (beta-lactamase superfamily II)|nr:MBL fold metallo-hydrolase [Tannerella sp.]